MSFWQRVKATTLAVLGWLKAHLLAPGVALLVVIGGVLLVAMGVKDLQIGGLLARILGRKSDAQAVDVANTIPEGRVDPQGNLIPIGKPDEKGYTQATVVPIHEPGLFSNPSVVTITPPGTTTPVKVELPTGVTAKDVDKVVVVSPGQFVVTVKSESAVGTADLDDILGRYGG